MGKRASLIADTDLRRVINTTNISFLVEAQHLQNLIFIYVPHMGVLFISRGSLIECRCAHVRCVVSRWAGEVDVKMRNSEGLSDTISALFSNLAMINGESIV